VRILLTGANSFLGRHLARHLLTAGHTVVATYRTDDGRLADLKRLAGDLALLRFDLADSSGFSLLPRSIDAVVHVAGVSDAPDVSVETMLRCNVDGSVNLHRYALVAGARKLIYASTLSVHGRIVEPTVDHQTPIRDPDIYGASKFLAERLFAKEAGRLPTAVLRLPGVLGPGAHRAWLPTLLARIRHGGDVEIHSPDNSFNNAAHVDDIGAFVLALLAGRWEGFAAMPLGAAGMITVRQAVERLTAAGIGDVRIRVRSTVQPGFTIDSALARERFGYRPMEVGAMLDRFAAEG
jgi:nucleoside-diphosphate-sugar epimerase